MKLATVKPFKDVKAPYWVCYLETWKSHIVVSTGGMWGYKFACGYEASKSNIHEYPLVAYLHHPANNPELRCQRCVASNNKKGLVIDKFVWRGEL